MATDRNVLRESETRFIANRGCMQTATIVALLGKESEYFVYEVGHQHGSLVRLGAVLECGQGQQAVELGDVWVSLSWQQ